MKRIFDIAVMIIGILIGAMFTLAGWHNASTATDKAAIAQNVVVMLLGIVWIMFFLTFLVYACIRQNHHSTKSR